MPFNGSGVFARIYNWVTDAGNGVPITASRVDADMADVVGALNNCVTRDGQGYFSADINANGNSLKNVTAIKGPGAVQAMALDASGNVSMSAILVAKALQETKVAMAANNIDLSAGNVFSKTISGATTLMVSNIPAAGTVGAFQLNLTNGGSATLTWWSGIKWAAGISPTLTAAGRDRLAFITEDGGTTWDGFVIGKGMA